MKNIMNTTLVAVAVAIAFVGSVDARAVRRSTMAPKSQEQAIEILEIAEKAVEDKNKANELVDVLNPANMTENQREIAVLKMQEKDTVDSITFRENELKNIGYGWFDFGATEKKEKYTRTNQIIAGLKKDLASIRADIKELEPAVGRSWVSALTTGLKAAVVVGVIGTVAAAIDQYANEGKGRAAVMAQGRRAVAAGKRGATATGKYASEKYTAGKEAVTSRYNRMRGTAPVVAPVVAPEVYVAPVAPVKKRFFARQMDSQTGL